MKEIVIATKNAHKIVEMKKVLEPLGYQVLTLFDFEEFPEIIEDGTTFKENALKKAKELSLYLNKDVISDDSGLEVFSLNNEPGVYSARYSGENKSYEDNNDLLLKNMENILDRRARFVTTICLYRIGEEPMYFEDYLNGEISRFRKGENGFGYDPIFIIEDGVTHLAEVSLEMKNEISHRGKCLKKLITYLINNK
jgi:XTP/dITP diphosphohydrolase